MVEWWYYDYVGWTEIMSCNCKRCKHGCQIMCALTIRSQLLSLQHDPNSKSFQNTYWITLKFRSFWYVFESYTVSPNILNRNFAFSITQPSGQKSKNSSVTKLFFFDGINLKLRSSRSESNRRLRATCTKTASHTWHADAIWKLLLFWPTIARRRRLESALDERSLRVNF